MSSNLNSGNPVVGYRRPNQAYAAPGTLTNDIQLNRGDELLILDRERQDQQEKILEQATTIRNLQLHGRYHFEILNKRGSSFDFWYGEQSSSLVTRVLYFHSLMLTSLSLFLHSELPWEVAAACSDAQSIIGGRFEQRWRCTWRQRWRQTNWWECKLASSFDPELNAVALLWAADARAWVRQRPQAKAHQPARVRPKATTVWEQRPQWIALPT